MLEMYPPIFRLQLYKIVVFWHYVTTFVSAFLIRAKSNFRADSRFGCGLPQADHQ